LGKNGSGKSIILSQLNPYRTSNDNRKDIILKDKKGYKEIHYSKGNSKYIIKHYYGKNSSQNKSFISKDGEELNENGGIRLFDDIVSNELNVTKDYFTVGRLGDNVSNFIDYSTTERKKYINKFIPNIDEYLKAFEVVREKWSDIRKRLKNLNTDLEKYSEFDVIKKNKADTEKAIESYREDLDNYRNQLTTASTKRDMLIDDINNSYDFPDGTIDKLEYIDSLLNSLYKEMRESERLINENENLKNYNLEESMEKKSKLEVVFNKAESDLDQSNVDII